MTRKNTHPIKTYPGKDEHLHPSAAALLALAGTWQDERSAKEIVAELRSAKRNCREKMLG